MRLASRSLGLICSCALACTVGEGDNDMFATSAATADTSSATAPEVTSITTTPSESGSATTSNETSGATADSTSTSTSTDEGTVFDLGRQPDIVERPKGTCEKVDVVLSVDASSSMAAEIATLPATFVVMKDTLALEVGNGITDFHIAVINACPDPPFFHNWAAGDTDCEFPDGQNWLASEYPEIDAKFACVVDIPLQDEALDEYDGINGGYDSEPDFCLDGDDEDEQPALTAAASVQADVLENMGFLREDAILLVVAITDEDEAFADVGDAQEIHDLLLAAKNGVANNITFLGIGGGRGGCPSAYDGSSVDDSQNLREVADSFGMNGLYRDMCEGASPDPIRDAFEEALTTIVDAACDNYIPG